MRPARSEAPAPPWTSLAQAMAGAGADQRLAAFEDSLPGLPTGQAADIRGQVGKAGRTILSHHWSAEAARHAGAWLGHAVVSQILLPPLQMAKTRTRHAKQHHPQSFCVGGAAHAPK